MSATIEEIRAAWERVRGEVTSNYVSDEAWDAIAALDELLDPLPSDAG